ncbi:MAG: hypothetical protein AABW71_00470 [Nanoarchaeota archaeon]
MDHTFSGSSIKDKGTHYEATANTPEGRTTITFGKFYQRDWERTYGLYMREIAKLKVNKDKIERKGDSSLVCPIVHLDDLTIIDV